MPEVFSLCDDVLLYNGQSGDTKQSAEKNPAGFSSGKKPH